MEKMSHLKSERVSDVSIQCESPAWAGRVIVFLGVGFIVTSLHQMLILSDVAHYRYIFQDYPEGYVHFRFLVSWGSRWLGLASGIGLLFRKEFFRKALIVIASGTIAVVYWKHPVASCVRHFQYLNEVLPVTIMPFSLESVIQYLQACNMSWVSVSWFAQLICGYFVVLDISCALGAIFLMMRPSVKSLFR